MMHTRRLQTLTLRRISVRLSYCLLSSLLLCYFVPRSVAEVTPPAIQLASEFNRNSINHGLNIKDFLISEKLDGVRGYWNGSQLLTRQGNTITTPIWFTANFPNYPLDGELWLGHGQFEAISGLARQKSPKVENWRLVRFMVFDLPKAQGNFAQRYQTALNELSGKSPYLEVIPQFQLETIEALYQKLDSLVSQGAEGLMLHRSSATYVVGRNSNLMKLKPYYDAEATVIGYVAGKGQFAGKMGALTVQTADGRIFNIGTGFNLVERQHPPVIGTLITYKYLGLTINGLPRFTRYLRVRSDVENDK